MDKEIFRQIVHLILGLIILAFALFFGQNASIFFLLTCLWISIIFSLYILKTKKCIPLIDFFLESCEREHEKRIPLQALIIYLAGALISFYFFPFKTALTCIAVLAFGDSFSTIIGKKFGKTKFPEINIWKIKLFGSKSLEGSIAGTLITLIPVYLIQGNIFIALIACVVGMLAELLIPIDDSISIPLSVGITLKFLGN